jgi:hypothetical protein
MGHSLPDDDRFVDAIPVRIGGRAAESVRSRGCFVRMLTRTGIEPRRFPGGALRMLAGCTAPPRKEDILGRERTLST